MLQTKLHTYPKVVIDKKAIQHKFEANKVIKNGKMCLFQFRCHGNQTFLYFNL